MTGIFLAFIVDLFIGDPVYAFHPVRVMGKMIQWSESALRQWIKNNYVSGFLLGVMFPVGVFVFASCILYFSAKIHIGLAWVVNVLGIYAAISIHDLRKEAVRIYHDLQKNDLAYARKNLSRIVGRDTESLNDEEITRATVETVAESTVDGIVSPLFYAALGGAPLALAYKAVNTLDSMVGHRNERYKEFGYFPAKMDDIINWLPARLSYYFICIATFLTKLNLKSALISGAQEVKMVNSISNLPEATFAGALQIRLGGVNVYQGRTDRKPYLGNAERPLQSPLILDSIHLMVCSSWVTLIFCLIINFLIYKSII